MKGWVNLFAFVVTHIYVQHKQYIYIYIAWYKTEFDDQPRNG